MVTTKEIPKNPFIFIIFILNLFFVFFSSACSEEAAIGLAKTLKIEQSKDNLQGAWKSDCHLDPSFELYTTKYFHFSERTRMEQAELKMVFFHNGDRDCLRPLWQSKMSGRFFVRSQGLHLNWQQLLIRSNSSFGVEYLEERDLCGVTEWENTLIMRNYEDYTFLLGNSACRGNIFQKNQVKSMTMGENDRMELDGKNYEKIPMFLFEDIDEFDERGWTIGLRSSFRP